MREALTKKEGAIECADVIKSVPDVDAQTALVKDDDGNDGIFGEGIFFTISRDVEAACGRSDGGDLDDVDALGQSASPSSTVSKPLSNLFAVARKLEEKEASRSKSTPRSRTRYKLEYLHGGEGKSSSPSSHLSSSSSSVIDAGSQQLFHLSEHRFCLHVGTNCLITSLYKTLSDAQVRGFCTQNFGPSFLDVATHFCIRVCPSVML